jgi:hypothetical protein
MGLLRLFTATGPLQQHDSGRLPADHDDETPEPGRHCTPSFYARLPAQGREQREGTAD